MSVLTWLKESYAIDDFGPGPHVLEGTVDGAAVSVRFVMESHGSVTLWRTEVAVPYTPETPSLRFALRPDAWLYKDDVKNGLMRDLELGDPDFDREFVVDGAPADVLRELFDTAMRARLLALRPIAVHTERQTLVVSRSDWVRDFAVLEDFVLLTIDLVRRVEPACALATARARNDAADYRSFKTATEIAEDRAKDMRAVDEMDERRVEARRRESIAIGRALRWVGGAVVLVAGVCLWRCW